MTNSNTTTLPRRRNIGDVVIGSAHHHFVVKWFNKNDKNEHFSLIRDVKLLLKMSLSYTENLLEMN